MIFKALVLAILIYYALKTAGNLYRAVQGGAQQSRMDGPSRGTPHSDRRAGGRSGGDRAGRERATRDRGAQDIEDATWEDIE